MISIEKVEETFEEFMAFSFPSVEKNSKQYKVSHTIWLVSYHSSLVTIIEEALSEEHEFSAESVVNTIAKIEAKLCPKNLSKN